MPSKRRIMAGALLVGLIGAVGWREHREPSLVLHTLVVGQPVSFLMVDRAQGRAVLTAWSSETDPGRELLLDTGTGALLRSVLQPGIPPTMLLNDGTAPRFVAQNRWNSMGVSASAG